MQGVVTKGWGLASQAKSWASGRVMELVQISIELREKDESKKTKSKAGDLLRKLAEDLNQVIESTASQDTDSFLGPWG
nr:hypothetical protein BaRGS_031558 [Batillaria attramentaria]